MEKYIFKKAYMTECVYKDSFSMSSERFEMEVKDSITCISIDKKEISFDFTRKLQFTPEKQFEVYVVFRCCILCNKEIKKEEFIEDIKNEKCDIDSLISRISYLISSMTINTPFGTIITAPVIDAKNIEIN